MLHERMRAFEASNDPNSEMKPSNNLIFYWGNSGVPQYLLKTWLTPKLCQFYKFFLYFHKHLEPGFIWLWCKPIICTFINILSLASFGSGVNQSFVLS
jgi:hypothetical protein